MALLQEFRFAARMLAKNKGWTSIAVLALALGLGANVAIFSVVSLMLWAPLPYPQSEQLIHLRQTNRSRGFSQASVSYKDVRDWAAAPAIAATAAYQSRPVAFSGAGEPQHLPAMQVTPEFFPTLGVTPSLGRAFLASESPDTDGRSAIISHELWQGMFRGDPGVIGRDIRLDGRNYTVAGVMPAGFQYVFQRIDIFVPLRLEKEQRDDRGWRGLVCIGRLRPGASIEQADAQVQAISERIERENPKSGRGWRGSVRSITAGILGQGSRAAAKAMFGAVGFVLLIACANVASLLLARGTQRRREWALRASLGASRGSLIRLQMAESVLLSLLGGALGVVSAFWTIPLLKRIAPQDFTVLQLAGVDWSVLAFGFGLSLLTGAVFGVVPAWLLTRGDLTPHLQEGSRGSSGGRHFMLKSLVAGEIALALILLAASSLLIRSLMREYSAEPGFDKNNLVAGHVLLSPARYPEKQQIVNFFSGALERLRGHGGVESAALVQTIPLGGNNSYTRVDLDGREEEKQDNNAGDMVVSPGYFDAMRIPLLVGREFQASDTPGSQKVAIVNSAFVKRYWPNVANPIGRTVRAGGPRNEWMTVVGVAADVRHVNVFDPPRPEVYRPHTQSAQRIMMLVARGRGTVSTAAEALRGAVAQTDRDQPVFRLQSLEALLANRSAGSRATTQVLGGLSILALALAAIGTYGVLAYTVAQRLREIGIRLALGATRSDVFRMVLRSGLTLAGIGVAIGLPAAYAMAPLLGSITAGLDQRDAGAYGGVAAMLVGVAVIACVLPAWRAMRVDPATVLRQE